ncbi:MAG: hypothetical protein C0598_03565 [Marinilabiliales bacterium]|nr:MAG: hypothetical protein C0598_03565 [Marinilabiliales bacterium]
MIQTVLRNLISNAIKFTNSKGEVIIYAQKRNGMVLVTVKDNGVGMDKDRIDTLFDLDSNETTLGTNEEKGSGLGLLLCKEFVEKIGGKIWAESKIGEGSIFKFTIPQK